ncbi:AT-rich interactive domain-containing protein 5-like isoform X2 [Nicotiana sylvestris]|uniref:AT-rich interactive domain-containing protein 5 isoform X2 n=2 Tax=Nicotiana TaxID=4085 RepID=A0A1S4C7P5_TOBAC|nr:PREDICTED: AT-rich interactive domain-containing protein 5-like isoform X2 [Nicotiana sylvestris]XP_016496964.1 PREDICTED: AT-rich interactive domain-containing protein 5-like isoform X2 [Nicotiana tabacum]
MDKSDVEMEDAEKNAQDVENMAESETNTLNSTLKPEGSAVDGQQSTESLVDCQDSAKPATQDQNNYSESGAKSRMLAENGNGEQKTASNIVESESNVNDEAVGQTGSKGVVEEFDAKCKVEDQRNAASETPKQNDTISQPETQDIAVGDDQNGSGIESLDQNNATGRTEGENEIDKKEGDLDADVALKNEESIGNATHHDSGCVNMQVYEELPANEVNGSGKEVKELPQAENSIEEVHQNGDDMMVDEHKELEDNTATVITDGDARSNEVSETKDDVKNTATAKMPEPVTPNLPVKSATAKAGQHTGEASNKIFDEAKMEDEDDEDEDWSGDGSPEDQAAFMIELESFYRERAMEFKPPKFYGHQLNCLKLWRSVIRLGGYDRVTGSKLWRQVGESFNPPKTCTTVSWTFRIFYEKALLEYERHKTQSGKLRLPISALPEAGVDNEGNAYQTPGSGRARRDAAARAMQGWHEQRLLGCGEDKNANSTPKREKNLKSIGSLKHKRPNEVENPAKAARTETSKQLVTTVVDLGPPADWVKINVRETKDCFEVYALVPGLLREEA